MNCPHCGQITELQSPGAQKVANSPAASAHRRRASRAILLSSLIVLVLAAGVAAWFLLSRHAKRTVVEPLAAAPVPTTPVAAPMVPSNAPPVQPAGPPKKSLEDLKAGDIRLEKTQGTSLVYAVGTIKNDSSFQRFGVRVELDLLNKAGAKVGTAKDYIDILEPHKAWQFRALIPDPRAVTAKIASIREDP